MSILQSFSLAVRSFSFTATAMMMPFALSVMTGCAGQDKARYGASVPNAGPCPAAMALHDTSRIVEIRGREIYSRVGFTGEILKVQASCRYYGEEPISVRLQVDFALGKGPAAKDNTRQYEWYVAVSRRNTAIAATERLAFNVSFPEGQNLVYHTEILDEITIPRSTPTLSGSNFEILTGFMLTREQLAFNQSGKRFRIDAGS